MPASINLHYALDLWIHKSWRARKAKGRTIIVRNSYDFAAGFQNKRDAGQFLFGAGERPGRFGLVLHSKKESPGRVRAVRHGELQGSRRPRTFAYLVFTHDCGKTKVG